MHLTTPYRVNHAITMAFELNYYFFLKFPYNIFNLFFYTGEKIHWECISLVKVSVTAISI